MKVLNRGLTATALAALALTAACSSDDNNDGGGNPSTVWTGIIQADNAAAFGALQINAATDAPAPPALSAMAPITASVGLNVVAPAAATLSLGGTYDPATDQLAVDDQSYILAGTFDGTSRLEGTWSGPGPTQGVFVSLLDNDGTGQAFCGTFTGTPGSGSFGFVVVNGVLAGNYYTIGSTTPVAVDGTVAGGTAITLAGATTGTGTITPGTPSTATGTFDIGADTFTWTTTDCTP
jgi:fibronectin-binding autotransporter adhesin